MDDQMQIDQQQQNVAPIEIDDLTQLKDNFLVYMDQITRAIKEIQNRSGPLRHPDSVNEDDMMQSPLEVDRRSHQGIEDYSPEKNQQDVIQHSYQVMATYKQLQTQIQALDNDYNKDEQVLLDELRELQNKNTKSLKKYQQVKHNAQQAKDELTKILEPFRQQ